VLAGTLAFLVASLVAAGSISEGLPMEDLAPDTSYIQDYYELQDATFGTQTSESVNMYFKNVDHEDPKVQLKIFEAWDFVLQTSKFASPKGSEGGSSPDSMWLSRMYYFAVQNKLPVTPCRALFLEDVCSQRYAPPVVIPESDFYSILDAFINENPDVKLQVHRGEKGKVVHSVLMFNLKSFEFKKWSKAYVDITNTEREVNQEVFPNEEEDSVILYSLLLVYAAQDLVLWDEAIQNLALAGAGVLIVCSFTFVHPLMTLLMGLSIFIIDSYLFGLLYFASILFNSISAINLVMSIGLSVDYTMHVMQCFLTIEAETKRDRAFMSLKKMGVPVMMGAFTSLVGVLPLAFASSMIFRTFFQMISATVGFAAYVGLIVMPIILSFVGPPPILARDIERIPS